MNRPPGWGARAEHRRTWVRRTCARAALLSVWWATPVMALARFGWWAPGWVIILVTALMWTGFVFWRPSDVAVAAGGTAFVVWAYWAAMSAGWIAVP